MYNAIVTAAVTPIRKTKTGKKKITIIIITIIILLRRDISYTGTYYSSALKSVFAEPNVQRNVILPYATDAGGGGQS